jgi:hypothetical protein
VAERDEDRVAAARCDDDDRVAVARCDDDDVAACELPGTKTSAGARVRQPARAAARLRRGHNLCMNDKIKLCVRRHNMWKNRFGGVSLGRAIPEVRSRSDVQFVGAPPGTEVLHRSQ